MASRMFGYGGDTKNGKFSVKEAYNEIMHSSTAGNLKVPNLGLA